MRIIYLRGFCYLLLLVTANVLWAQNTRPVITGQSPDPVSAVEDQPFDVSVSWLIISDQEDSVFTVEVLAGSEYSFSGTQITPTTNYHGPLSVSVVAYDGTDYSDPYPLQVEVAAVEDPPVITGQTAVVQVPEDNPLTLSAELLIIEDPDPLPYTLIILDGIGYTYSGSVITPSENYNGMLTVNVQITDGSLTSNTFPMQVEVTAVNDIPVIRGQTPVPLAIPEDQSVAIFPENLIVSDDDADDVYPEGFTLTISPGANYTVAANVVTPDADFYGVLEVPVYVSDGEATSESYNLKVHVSPVNDPPVITGVVSPLTVDEDTPLLLQVSDLVIRDSDDTYPGGFTLTVLAGENYTVSGRTVTPFINFNGTLSVPVTVSDGEAVSEPFAVQVQVAPVNDAPAILSQAAISISSGEIFTIASAHLIVEDVDNTYPGDFTVTAYPGSFYTVSGLTVTPISGFTGTLSVPVSVSDGLLSSNIFNLRIQVAVNNTAPVITGQVPLTMNEGGQLTIGFADIAVSDPDNTYPAGFSMLILPGNNYTVSGTTIIPATEFSGTISAGVQVNDGIANSAPFNLQVTVVAVNDPPRLDNISDISVSEDSDVQNVVLTGISAGPLESQTLTVSAASDNPALFEIFELIYQSPQPTGVLRVKPQAGANGAATVTVTVSDNAGGTISRSFDFNVIPVNDPPVFTSTPVLIASTGIPYEYKITVTDPDAEDNITLSVLQKPGWLSLIVADGIQSLAGVPAEGSEGSSVVVLEARDETGAVARQEFTLVVNSRPVLTNFTVATEEDTPFVFSREFHNSWFDPDNQPLEKIIITSLPLNGSLLLDGQVLGEGSEVSEAQLPVLRYEPVADFFGIDTVRWNASDGLSQAASPAFIFVNVSSLNDPPEIVSLDTAVLNYNMENGPVLISEEFQARDADNDSLVNAEIGFRRQNFVSGEDILTFEPTANIQGSFDATAGILFLSGKAPVSEYNEAIRSVTYENVSAMYLEEPILKTIFYTLSDGQDFSLVRDKVIRVIDSFDELEIPNGFTPDNREPNDTWRIGNIRLYPRAQVRVYNSRGMLVFSSVGYEREWDGTLNGQPLPVDTYYYAIDLNLQNRKKSYRGSVTILR